MNSKKASFVMKASKYFLIVISATFVLNCSYSVAEPDAKIKFGALLTLSSNFASVGEDCRKGIEAALDISDSRDLIDVVYSDSRNEPAYAIGELRKLKESDNVLGVFANRSTIGMSLNPIALKMEVPFLGAVAHKDFAVNNKFAFQIWSTSDEEADFLATKIKELNYKKVALVYTEDDWTTAVSTRFKETLKNLGVNIVFDQSVLPSETDFKSLVLKMKQKEPDAVFMNVVLPQISPLLKSIRQYKTDVAVFSNIYVAKKEVVDGLGAEALEGIRYVEIDIDLPALQSKLGLNRNQPPPGLSVSAYISTMLLAQAVKENKDIKTSDDLYRALLLQQEIKTPDFTFEVKNRYVKFPLALKGIRNGVAGKFPESK